MQEFTISSLVFFFFYYLICTYLAFMELYNPLFFVLYTYFNIEYKENLENINNKYPHSYRVL